MSTDAYHYYNVFCTETNHDASTFVTFDAVPSTLDYLGVGDISTYYLHQVDLSEARPFPIPLRRK